MKYTKFSAGMTLIELILSATLLLFVLTMVMNVYANFSSTKRKTLLSATVQAETQFLFDRIVKEIHAGTIDYQGYWRENNLMKHQSDDDKKVSENWIYEDTEGVNEKGAQPNTNARPALTPRGLNSVKNCGKPVLGSHRSDTDTEEKQKDILFNYRYQFIYPGKESAAPGNGNDETTDIGGSVIHLNCITDKYNKENPSAEKGYNVYDDEPAHGKGPRAMSNSPYVAVETSAQGSKMLWSWKETEKARTGNNPPLLLVRKTIDGNFIRTALRLRDGHIEMIEFISADDQDMPPDGITDKWLCQVNYNCDDSLNGSYVWSDKAYNGNGIGTLSDEKLNWKSITPSSIEVTDFDFVVSPVKDPNRAFYELPFAVKPQVSLVLKTKAKESVMKGIKGEAPTLFLQTTATPRTLEFLEVDN
jgi:type II secretory pathway pseudopilin PulG